MMYIVEVGGTKGSTATKQYEAHTLAEVLRLAEIDLWDYPDLHIIDVRPVLVGAGPLYSPAHQARRL